MAYGGPLHPFDNEVSTTMIPQSIVLRLRTLTETNTVGAFSANVTSPQKHQKWFIILANIVKKSYQIVSNGQVHLAALDKGYNTHLDSHKNGADEAIKRAIHLLQQQLTAFLSKLAKLQVHLGDEKAFLPTDYKQVLDEHKTELNANHATDDHISKFEIYLSEIEQQVDLIVYSVEQSCAPIKAYVLEHLSPDQDEQTSASFDGIHSAFKNSNGEVDAISKAKNLLETGTNKLKDENGIAKEVKKIEHDLEELNKVQKNIKTNIVNLLKSNKAPTEHPKANVSHKKN